MATSYRVVHGGNSRGRVTVATRLLAPGEIVLTEHAVACVATAGRPVCDDCLTPTSERGDIGSFHRCVGCRSRFGSSGGSATPRGSSSLSCAVRLAAKILARRCSGTLGARQTSAIDRLMHQRDEHQQVESTHHEDRSSRSEQDEEDCTQVARLAAGMGCVAAGASRPIALSAERGEPAVPADAALLDLARKELARVSLNAINTCDGAGATGLGLFPEAAMFNHGCCPNCQAWWRGSKLEVRCTKPVAAGEELCFSYIPIDQPSAVRRAQLRDNWFFTCLCGRCVSGRWDAELTGLKCSGASCSGALPPPWGTGGRGTPCNKCGSLRSAEPEPSGPAGHQGAGHASRRGWAGPASPPSGRGVASLARPPHPPDTGDGRRGGSHERNLGRPTAEEGTLAGSDGVGDEERLARASAAFETGVRAYMREDPEEALLALGESLRVRERLLHPFNKELLRTLRYASYAAVATHRWAMARSFLIRWLHPMETMFGAAEAWDVAAMRIDAGLVLDRLQGGPQGQAAPSAPSDDRAGNAACSELAEGLRWIWICLGRDSGLPAEAAALEVCAHHGVSL